MYARIIRVCEWAKLWLCSYEYWEKSQSSKLACNIVIAFYYVWYGRQWRFKRCRACTLAVHGKWWFICFFFGIDFPKTLDMSIECCVCFLVVSGRFIDDFTGWNQSKNQDNWCHPEQMQKFILELGGIKMTSMHVGDCTTAGKSDAGFVCWGKVSWCVLSCLTVLPL